MLIAAAGCHAAITRLMPRRHCCFLIRHDNADIFRYAAAAAADFRYAASGAP